MSNHFTIAYISKLQELCSYIGGCCAEWQLYWKVPCVDLDQLISGPNTSWNSGQWTILIAWLFVTFTMRLDNFEQSHRDQLSLFRTITDQRNKNMYNVMIRTVPADGR